MCLHEFPPADATGVPYLWYLARNNELSFGFKNKFLLLQQLESRCYVNVYFLRLWYVISCVIIVCLKPNNTASFTYNLHDLNRRSLVGWITIVMMWRHFARYSLAPEWRRILDILSTNNTMFNVQIHSSFNEI
jgi:hypothetical protein